MAETFVDRKASSRNHAARNADMEPRPPSLSVEFTAAEICAAFKAAWQDFVSGKTNRKAIETIATLLNGALEARRQIVRERDNLTSQFCERVYLN